MGRLPERSVVAVALFSIALAAFFQASTAATLLGVALARDATAIGFGRGRADSKAFGASPAIKTAEAILRRNPFDSVTGALIDRPIETQAQQTGASDPLAAPVCDGIRVTMVTESADRGWSMASLLVPGESGARLLRPGDQVGGGQIVHIGHNPRKSSPAVWLTSNSTICQALLFAALPPPAAVTAAATPAQPPSGGSAASGPLAAALADITSRIKKLSETEYEVDRGVIDTVLKNQMLLMQVRIVPEHKGGDVVGIRLFGIRPDSLLGVLGFSNGDRLESINGVDMVSPQKLLEAYARLPAATRLTVKVNRRGQAASIDYRLK